MTTTLCFYRTDIYNTPEEAKNEGLYIALPAI